MKHSFSAFLTSAVLMTTLCMAAPNTAHANQEELSRRLMGCKDITSILTRAECYDTVIRDFDLVNMNRIDNGASGGKWKVTKERSPVTGNMNYYAILPSNDYVPNSEGKFNRPSLVIRCTDTVLSGYVVFDTNLGQSPILINTRLGNGKTEADRWDLSADRTAAFIKGADDFAKKIMTQEGIFISAWPEKEPINASFDLSGTSVALKPLQETCPPKPKAQ